MTPLKPASPDAAAAAAAGPSRDAGHDAWRTAWRREMERAQADAWFAHGVVGGLPMSHAAPSLPAPAPLSGAQAANAAHREPAHEGAADARPDAAPQPRAPWAARPPAAVAVRASAAGLRTAAAQADAAATGAPARPTAAQAAAVQAFAAGLASAGAGAAATGGVRAPDAQALAQPLARAALPVHAAARCDARAETAHALTGQDTVAAQAELEAARQAARDQAAPLAQRDPVRLHAEWTATGVNLWLGLDAGAAVPAAQLLQQLQRSLGASGCRLLSLTCNGLPVPLDPDGSPSSNFLKEMEGSPWPSTP